MSNDKTQVTQAEGMALAYYGYPESRKLLEDPKGASVVFDKIAKDSLVAPHHPDELVEESAGSAISTGHKEMNAFLAAIDDPNPNALEAAVTNYVHSQVGQAFQAQIDRAVQQAQQLTNQERVQPVPQRAQAQMAE